MIRIDRRLRLLRGRPKPFFDPELAWLDRAGRARVARKLRATLRRLEPVVLVTPRWSQAQRFLDDLSADLAIEEPVVHARPLALLPLAGRSVEESWAWLTRAIVEFCGLPLGTAVAQAVSRTGFRAVMSGLFRRSTAGTPRVLMMHGVEHLHVEARDDLLRAFEAHVEEAGPERRLGILLAGSVDGPNFEFQGSKRVMLADFAPDEAIEALAEYVGATDRQRLAEVVALLGGVPALLDRIGAEAERAGRLTIDRESVWRALGPLADEVRGAVAIVSAVDGLAERLEEVQRAGPCPEDARWDRMLVRAGLLVVQETTARRVALRAPLFADLAAAR